MSWQLRFLYWLLPGLTESVQLCVAAQALDAARSKLTVIAQLNCNCVTDLAERGVEDIDATFNTLNRVPGNRLPTLREVFSAATRGSR